MPTLLDRDWSWLELAAAPAAAVLLPLVLHRVFSSRKAKTAQARASSAGPSTLEDYITKHGMSELDAKFQVAVDFVAARAGKRLTNEQRLTLYAFYKQALFGACAVEKPSAADFVGSAKWESWRALGAMEADAAKQQYLALVQDLFDDFDVSGARPRSASSGSCSSREELSLGNSISTAGFVSMPTVDMTSAEWQVQEDAFHFASTGDAAQVAHALETGFAVDAQDSEGRTMLHWAVDRSQTDVVALLLQHAASPNVQDGDGMTPLHYAASCEHDELAQLLVDHGACVDIEDNDGETPLSCAPTDELAAILTVGKTQAAK